MSKYFAIVAVLLLVIVAGYWLFGNSKYTTTYNPATSASASPTATPDQTLQIINQARQTRETDNIRIFAPQANATVGKSFQVSGQARVFENQFSIRVVNTRTNAAMVTIQAYANAKDAGQYGPFSATIDLNTVTNLQDGDNLLVEAYDNSPKDGAETDLVRVPVTYQP